MMLMLALFTNNVLRERLPTDEQLRQQGILVLPRPRALQPFQLQAHTGAPFTEGSLTGQWTFAYFGFTHCPDICPTTLALMAQAEQQLRDSGVTQPFRLLLVSLDPERDTVQVLAQYAPHFSPNLLGVTAGLAAIEELAAQVSVGFIKVEAADQPDGYTVDHTSNIIIFNPHGHHQGYIRPPHTAQQIVTAYRALSPRI